MSSAAAPINLIELTYPQVVGFNQKAIADRRAQDPTSKEVHSISGAGEAKLLGRLGGIFARNFHGVYYHLPIENIAALILYRIAEAQAFENGNKRTALLSCYFFLYNNGYNLKIDKGRINDLLWGFARDENDPSKPPRYNESHALEYIHDNISVRH